MNISENNTAPLHPALNIIHKIEDGLLIFTVFAMLSLAIGQIVLRTGLHINFTWGDSVLRMLVLWVGMLGALSAARDDNHIRLDFLNKFFNPFAQKIIKIITNLFTALVSLIIAYYAFQMVMEEREAGSALVENLPLLGELPMWWAQLILPLGFGLLGVRALIQSVLLFKPNSEL